MDEQGWDIYPLGAEQLADFYKNMNAASKTNPMPTTPATVVADWMMHQPGLSDEMRGEVRKNLQHSAADYDKSGKNYAGGLPPMGYNMVPFTWQDGPYGGYVNVRSEPTPDKRSRYITQADEFFVNPRNPGALTTYSHEAGHATKLPGYNQPMNYYEKMMDYTQQELPPSVSNRILRDYKTIHDTSEGKVNIAHMANEMRSRFFDNFGGLSKKEQEEIRRRIFRDRPELYRYLFTYDAQ